MASFSEFGKLFNQAHSEYAKTGQIDPITFDRLRTLGLGIIRTAWGGRYEDSWEDAFTNILLHSTGRSGMLKHHAPFERPDLAGAYFFRSAQHEFYDLLKRNRPDAPLDSIEFEQPGRSAANFLLRSYRKAHQSRPTEKRAIEAMSLADVADSPEELFANLLLAGYSAQTAAMMLDSNVTEGTARNQSAEYTRRYLGTHMTEKLAGMPERAIEKILPTDCEFGIEGAKDGRVVKLGWASLNRGRTPTHYAVVYLPNSNSRTLKQVVFFPPNVAAQMRRLLGAFEPISLEQQHAVRVKKCLPDDLALLRLPIKGFGKNRKAAYAVTLKGEAIRRFPISEQPLGALHVNWNGLYARNPDTGATVGLTHFDVLVLRAISELVPGAHASTTHDELYSLLRTRLGNKATDFSSSISHLETKLLSTTGISMRYPSDEFTLPHIPVEQRNTPALHPGEVRWGDVICRLGTNSGYLRRPNGQVLPLSGLIFKVARSHILSGGSDVVFSRELDRELLKGHGPVQIQQARKSLRASMRSRLEVDFKLPGQGRYVAPKSIR